MLIIKPVLCTYTVKHVKYLLNVNFIGVLQKHKWENAMTIDKHSWGFRREAKLADILTYEELIEQLVSTVSCGGLSIHPQKLLII
jgi:hypothetical protein